jgi:hypothetical protein
MKGTPFSFIDRDACPITSAMGQISPSLHEYLCLALTENPREIGAKVANRHAECVSKSADGVWPCSALAFFNKAEICARNPGRGTDFRTRQ